MSPAAARAGQRRRVHEGQSANGAVRAAGNPGARVHHDGAADRAGAAEQRAGVVVRNRAAAGSRAGIVVGEDVPAMTAVGPE